MKQPLFPRSAIPSGVGIVFASFSGGADSLALLLSLADYAADAPWELRAVHFEHGIRGEESLADAEFCRTVCEQLNIPFQLVPLDVPANMRPGEGIEAAARRLRHEAWRPIIAGAGKSAAALGHHAGDRIETFFLRLMRGSNTSGLNALRPVRDLDGILWIRPMLGVSRAGIEQYLDGCPFQYRTDSTNLQNDYARNKLRNIVLPILYREFPRAAAGLQLSLDAAAEDADFLDDAAKTAFQDILTGDGGIFLSKLASKHPALLPRILRIWLSAVNGLDVIPDHALVMRIRPLLDHPAQITGNKRIPVSGGMILHIRRGRLYCTPAADKAPDRPCETIWLYQSVPAVLFGKTVLRFRGKMPLPEFPPDANSAAFDPVGFPAELTVSARHTGDEMIPFGAHSPKPLKKIFTDARVASVEQSVRPVVRGGSPEVILWVPGVRRSALFPAASGRDALVFAVEPLIDVTAAVIMNPDGRILVCSRPQGKHMAGKWEFPGGKIEPGETPEACIEREIREELGMKIAVGSVLHVMEHDYGVKYVRVAFFAARSSDAPSANDRQLFQWVSFDDLSGIDFLDADCPFASYLQKNAKKIAERYNNP